MMKNLDLKLRQVLWIAGVAVAAAGCLALAASAHAATLDFDGVDGDGTSWEDPLNWDSAGPVAQIPLSADAIEITGGGVNIDMDADTWQYLVDNALLTGGSTGEYRTQSIRLAKFGGATLNIDIGDGNIWRTTNSTLQYVGSGNGSNGTMNILSGDIRIETSSLRIAEKEGSTGLLNISGGPNTRLIVARETSGVSMQVGTGNSAAGSNGTFQIDSGKLRTRAGVIVGPLGKLRVLGSAVTEVEIGSESTLDGNWTQNGGGILEIGIDTGVTQINVADKGGAGTFATFGAGSLLDVGFLGSPLAGTWTVMEVQNGAITDNGLALAPGVASGWSFNVDNSGANGLLTVTYVPEPTSVALLALGGLLVLGRRRK